MNANASIFVSIVSIFCCFWPLGIVGLISSVMANSHFKKGNVVAAQKHLRMSKIANTMAITIGVMSIIGALLYFTFFSNYYYNDTLENQYADEQQQVDDIYEDDADNNEEEPQYKHWEDLKKGHNQDLPEAQEEASPREHHEENRDAKY
eukprot:TRINITY_DN1293_c0_g1_i2.p1 TRINITY_DN1293_c0_g1~~TRINITY_DN1293_c0_g1_i2.p1  ORF type:complete len:149 (-),score=42.60 TRINITY_DN1293_c0_g1_i2:35-481(-)